MEPNLPTISVRLPATPFSSSNRQRLGNEVLKSAPSCQQTPEGKVILSANTVPLVNLPSPSAGSSTLIPLGSSLSNSSAFRLRPAASVTNNRPFSSKQPCMG